jgi:hypothetical protein
VCIQTAEISWGSNDISLVKRFAGSKRVGAAKRPSPDSEVGPGGVRAPNAIVGEIGRPAERKRQKEK